MKILLAGQRSFGAAVLQRLLDGGHELSVVAPQGDVLATTATRLGVRCSPLGSIQPSLLEADGVELIIAAHSHDFIGKRSRTAARYGAIGYHPSLLPRHRGRDAIEWTIRMRDPIAGGSVYILTDNVDCGPVVVANWCHVRSGDTASSLWRRELFPMGVDLIEFAVLKIASMRRLVGSPQDSAVATWEPSLDSPPLYRPELPELGR
jgi:methionyl-tRNA formyltransferase